MCYVWEQLNAHAPRRCIWAWLRSGNAQHLSHSAIRWKVFCSCLRQFACDAKVLGRADSHSAQQSFGHMALQSQLSNISGSGSWMPSCVNLEGECVHHSNCFVSFTKKWQLRLAWAMHGQFIPRICWNSCGDKKSKLKLEHVV